MWQTYLTVALVSYLLGSIPFGYILVKLFLKQDIRQTGSGNIGATNVARSGKKGLAIATLLLDAAKGYAGVLVSLFLVRRVGDTQLALLIPDSLSYLPVPPKAMAAYWMLPYPQGGQVPWPHNHLFLLAATAAICAILGHCFPIWLRFKGGKGVATALGAFAFVCPAALAIAALSFGAAFAVTKIVSASSIFAALVFPIAAAFISWEFKDPLVIALVAGCSLVIILKHHANIRRLLNGTEPKFTTKKSALSSDPIQAEKNA
jgi:acyl phosphate:glycerol-3-phosphate acyltransferase